ncbi:MAG: translocation/assembly module TamB, partial [Akkermansiaceae bacterium]|nr:translocation/assembly module TamB [Akkermansiaceae bacterium]
LRWLAPRAASHFLPKAGLTGELRLEGNLTHGFSITGVNLQGSGTLATLTLNRVTPHYRWSQLVRGKLDGLTIDGLHADLRLDAPADPDAPPEPPDADKPLDLDALVATIRQIREQVLPVELHLTHLSLTTTKAEQPTFTLASSHLHHLRDSDAITLELGSLTDAAGRVWPAQTTTLGWAADRITLDRLDPHPSLGLSELTLHLPATEKPSLETLIRIDEAEFALSSTPGFTNANLILQSGTLDLARTARSFNLELPAEGKLTSLSLDAGNYLPSPLAVTVTLALGLEALSYQDWQIEELALGTVLETDQATLTLHAQALDTSVHLDSAIGLTRTADSILPGQATGTFQIPAIPALIRQLATRFPTLQADSIVPDSALTGKFTVNLTDNQLSEATLDTTLAPADPALATPIAIHARYRPEQPITADIALDGLKLAASYDLTTKSYQGTLDLTDFTTPCLTRWLAVAGVSLPGTAGLSAHWSGGGDLTSATHHGSLALTNASWQQPEQPAITATSTLEYAWPGKVHLDSLTANAENQTLTLAADLADDTLTLQRFLWLDGTTEIAEGTASLPVPADFAKWRDFLALDTRPAKVSIESRKLSLGLLKTWVPAAAQLDPRATGQLNLQLTGSCAKPDLLLTLDCRDLRAPDNPKLPPADLKLSLKAADTLASLDTTVTAPGYAPATLTASLPFHPAIWLDQPNAIQQENLTARLDLPRLELSRFTSLVPALKKLSGVVTGNVTAAGPLSAPEARGSIRLENAAATFANPSIPPVQDAGLELALTLKAVTLNNLRATVAGGSLTGSGSLTLTDHKPSAIDLRLRGDLLPLLRNDMLILRANAGLRPAGPWESASLTGTVGAVDSLFYRDIELLPIGKPFTTPSAASLPKLGPAKATGQASAIPAPFGNWSLNLDVRTQEPFLIRGNLAKGRVDVSLRVLGSLADPKLDGTATLADFTATLPFSTLKVKSGTVRFTPATGFDPILEIRGSAEPRPYRVSAFVFGMASDPQIMLTSNPPLPETEIMTLLATGTTTAGLEDTQAATNRAIQLFAEEIRRGRVRYTQRLRPLLGVLDRVDFSLKEADPYSTDSFSTATISLTDSWFVSAGMSDEGNTRLMGIWRISFK